MELIRYAYFEDRVLGFLLHAGKRYYTIEKPWRHNERNESCIPEGEYLVGRVDSPKFGRNRWEILDVPNRTHILIHAANYSRDVKGCVGLGTGTFANFKGVSNSRRAIQAFYEQTKLETELSLTISSGAMKWIEV